VMVETEPGVDGSGHDVVELANDLTGERKAAEDVLDAPTWWVQSWPHRPAVIFKREYRVREAWWIPWAAVKKHAAYFKRWDAVRLTKVSGPICDEPGRAQARTRRQLGSPVFGRRGGGVVAVPATPDIIIAQMRGANSRTTARTKNAPSRASCRSSGGCGPPADPGAPVSDVGSHEF
jgi:hypothetical protein